MSATLHYVDPSIAGDSGTGTIGDPWGDLQYALDQATRETFIGNQFNIKAGTDEILAAVLDFSTFGSPTAASPCIFRGYTSAENDGGIGGIDANGGQIISGRWLDGLAFIDLHLHNGTSALYMIDADNHLAMIRCEVEGNLACDDYARIFNCYFHNLKTRNYGIYCKTYGFVYGCFIDGTDGSEPAATYLYAGAYGNVIGNVVKTATNSARHGIMSSHDVIGNSIYCEGGGTGDGIYVLDDAQVMNNIVEGYSGVGGEGILVVAGAYLRCIASNAAFNNSTNFLVSPGDMWFEDDNNDVLAASPFTDPANDDFSVGTDADVKIGGFPSTIYGTLNFLDRGAAQMGGIRRSRIRIHGG